VLLLPSLAWGQSTFGSFTGTVKDPTGAVVPGAAVEVINEGTGNTRQVTTTSAGVFNVPNCDLGTYKVRVSAKGFSTYERGNLHLAANQVIDLPVEMALGTTTGLIEVREASPVIATETTDLSGSVGHDSMEALPLVGRHTGDGGVYGFTTLTTGAAAVPGSSTPILQGARSQVGILPTMDGIAVMAFPQGASPVQPSMEGIQEVKMETAVAPAEFSTAGNIQVVSKSGTNDYHGGAYWSYNGSRLNARNFFSSVVPFRVYNNFATSFGGPVRKNKLFLFGDYEASRESAKTTLVESVPLPAWKNGIFTAGVPRAITDPTSGQAFPGGMIPANRISKVAQNIQSYAYPDPNNGPPGTLANNWTANYPGNTGFTHYDHFDIRGDYNATSRDTIFARYSWRLMPLRVPGIYPLYREQDRHGQSSVVAWNHTISPAAFNEFRFGTTYHRNHYEADVLGTDLMQRFGLVGVTSAAVRTGPFFNITGVTPWSPDASSNNYQDNPETTLQWIDNVSWTRGRHFMKFGFDAVRDRFNGNNINSLVYGQYDFSGTYTGFGYADFLLGIPQRTTLAIPNPNRHLRGTTWGIYAQDQYKVSSSLTVNYGLRWELEQPYTDTKGALYTWIPSTGGLAVMDNGKNLVNPLYPKNIPITTASEAGYPSTLVRFNKKNFEPRVGFAYKPFHSDKTVVRGGYGIYSNLIYATVARSHLTGGPFSGSVTYDNAIRNGAPLFSFPTPVLASGSAAVQNVNGINPDLRSPYTQQWNFTVERQVASYGLRASYVGSRSVSLVYRRNLNLPVPSTIPFTTSRRPSQLYNQIIFADSGGTDAYHALELALQKRYGNNLTFSTGFTWAKDLTDTQDSGGVTFSGTTFAGQVIQDPNNRVIEKANNGNVVPRRFFAYGVYNLPFGRGQRVLSNIPGALNQVIGGWRVTFTAVMQSGQYFTPSFSASDPSGTGTIGGVPDRVGNGNIPDSRNERHFFDASAFVVPGCPAANPLCPNPAPVGRFGNSGYNILGGPPIRNLDFGLLKEFKYRDRYTMRFTMTMANALNHPNFTTPASNISSTGTVGVISSMTRSLLGEPAPREVDFSLRFIF
jgi:Carboxypeptidase regulatory-like domain